MAERDVCIIVPAFNESAALRGVLADLRGAGDWDIVVVDDGSSDDTAAVVAGQGCTVLRHVVNLGQGAALETGFEYARRRGYKIVVTFDADGQHRAQDVPALIEPIRRGEADLVLGSRFLGARSDDGPRPPFSRRVVLRMAARLERLTSGLQVTDAHCGLRAFSAAALRQITLHQSGMAHASEILRQVAGSGLRWREVPVRVEYTAYSRAKGQKWWHAALSFLDLLFEKFRV